MASRYEGGVIKTSFTNAKCYSYKTWHTLICGGQMYKYWCTEDLSDLYMQLRKDAIKSSEQIRITEGTKSSTIRCKHTGWCTYSTPTSIQAFHSPVSNAIILVKCVLGNVPHMLWSFIHKIRHTWFSNLNLHHLHKHLLNSCIPSYRIITPSFGTILTSCV